jgi:hypothetical protein
MPPVFQPFQTGMTQFRQKGNVNSHAKGFQASWIEVKIVQRMMGIRMSESVT